VPSHFLPPPCGGPTRQVVRPSAASPAVWVVAHRPDRPPADLSVAAVGAGSMSADSHTTRLTTRARPSSAIVPVFAGSAGGSFATACQRHVARARDGV